MESLALAMVQLIQAMAATEPVLEEVEAAEAESHSEAELEGLCLPPHRQKKQRDRYPQS
jgi:hypothetical protein